MKCKYLKNAMEVFCEETRDPDDKFCWNDEKDMKKYKYFSKAIEKNPLLQNEQNDKGE